MSGENEKITRVMTLCLIVKDGKILLGLKRKGFAQGLWNGFGGKIEKGETVEQATVRETQEEAGVTPKNLQKRGHIKFYQFNGEIFEVYFFSASDYSGEPEAKEKLIPKWFLLSDIPYDKMFPDDRIWLPIMLAGGNFTGEVWFDKNYQIERHTIKEV